MDAEPINFLEIAQEIERRAGAWCFMAAEGPDGEGDEWTYGSTLPDRAAEAIRHQAKYLELGQQMIDSGRDRIGRLITALSRIARDSNEPWAREFASLAISSDRITQSVEGPAT